MHKILSNPKEHMIPIRKMHLISKNTYSVKGGKNPKFQNAHKLNNFLFLTTIITVRIIKITINIIVLHPPLTSSHVSFINHGCFALTYNYLFIIILREDFDTLIGC
jgi:hypothetical protein